MAHEPASFERMVELKNAILFELRACSWASEIAERRKVTREAVLALFLHPDKVALCRQCTASGRVSKTEDCVTVVERCRTCGGRGHGGVTEGAS